MVLLSLQWKSGIVVHIGWTTNEDLLCIQDDGTVLIHNIFGTFKRHFSMGNVSSCQTLPYKLGPSHKEIADRITVFIPPTNLHLFSFTHLSQSSADWHFYLKTYLFLDLIIGYSLM